MDLIQPKQSDTDEKSQGQIYTNTSLWTLGALLAEKGVDISLHDENIRPITNLTSNIVGMNIVGAPYIPIAIETIKRLREQFGKELIFILGGQPLTQRKTKTGKILGLDDNQFQKLFGDGVMNGMKSGVLESLLKINNISDGRTISLIPMYEKLSDADFKDYFTREISLYVSQGCKYYCDFCAAFKSHKEEYRDEKSIYADLSYIVKRLQTLSLPRTKEAKGYDLSGKSKINNLRIYMSNLDVFQSPKQLGGFADMVLQIKKNNPGFTFSLRGLACTKSFIHLDTKYPDILEKLTQAGFNNVGYGVDGVGPEIWKGIKKPQNDEKEILDAIHFTKEKYNITPELFMVFGHEGIDTEKSLKDAYEFAEVMVKKYGANPRPYVAKSFVPGNDGRTKPEFQERVKLLIDHPILFHSLDYSALASRITHPDDTFRNLINHYYLAMCKLPGSTTLPILPYELGDSVEELERKRKENAGKFDR